MTRRAVEWTCRATVETTLAALESSGSSKLLELSGHKTWTGVRNDDGCR